MDSVKTFTKRYCIKCGKAMVNHECVNLACLEKRLRKDIELYERLENGNRRTV